MVVLVDGLDLDQFMLDLVVVADHTLEVVLKMDKIVLQDLMVDQAVAVSMVPQEAELVEHMVVMVALAPVVRRAVPTLSAGFAPA